MVRHKSGDGPPREAIGGSGGTPIQAITSAWADRAIETTSARTKETPPSPEPTRGVIGASPRSQAYRPRARRLGASGIETTQSRKPRQQSPQRASTGLSSSVGDRPV